MTTDNQPISDSLCRFNLTSTDFNRGFSMTFPNRVTVSIRWGTANYSDGRTTAECGAWNADTHAWIQIPDFDYNGDHVLPHMTTVDVARFIHNATLLTL